VTAVSEGQAARVDGLPRSYLVWLGGIVTSQLGDAVLYFGLGWAASSHGGAAAGLVLSMAALPKALLVLPGGAVGDRFGARRVLICGDAAMLVVAGLLAVLSWRLGTPVVLLMIAAFIGGVSDAFYVPASGSMPRRLVDTSQLSRAVALRQSGTQLVAMTGGPLGGVLVGLAGLPVVATADAVSFTVILLVLIRIRPRFNPPDRPATARGGILRDAAEGVRVAFATPGLRAVIFLISGAAGFILPVSSILVPLQVRAHGWGPSAAGLIVGTQSLGVILVTLTVARRGTATRPGIIAATALVITAAGQVVLALASLKVAAVAAAFVIGCGIGLLVSHMSPVLVTAAPESHLARVQSVFSLAQSSALLATNNIIGNLARTFGPAAGLAVCAAVVMACAGAAFASPALRTMKRPLRDSGK
jgi:MFS family permease